MPRFCGLEPTNGIACFSLRTLGYIIGIYAAVSAVGSLITTFAAFSIITFLFDLAAIALKGCVAFFGIDAVKRPDARSAKITSYLLRIWFAYRIATRLYMGMYFSQGPMLMVLLVFVVYDMVRFILSDYVFWSVKEHITSGNEFMIGGERLPHGVKKPRKRESPPPGIPKASQLGPLPSQASIQYNLHPGVTPQYNLPKPFMGAAPSNFSPQISPDSGWYGSVAEPSLVLTATHPSLSKEKVYPQDDERTPLKYSY